MLRGLVAVAVLLGAGGAAAEPSQTVRRIEQLYLESAWDEALAACQAALEAEQVSVADKQEALKYMGTILFAQGNSGEARNAFARLLRRDPRYRLPSDWPPRVVEFFERLRVEVLPPPRIRHRVPPGFRIGTPIVVSAQILFLTESHRARLHWRIGTAGRWSVVDMERDQGDLYSAIVPTTPLMSPDSDTRLEYYIVVRDGAREVLTEGTAQRPHSFLVGRVEGLPDRSGGGGGGRAGRVDRDDGGGFPWLVVGLSGLAAIGLGVGAFFLLSATAEDETGQVRVRFTLD